MKTIQILLAVALLPLGNLALTSCTTTGGGSSVITTAEQWLTDPANQALINAIAQTVISLIGGLGERKSTTNATVTGQIAQKYPNVPAGALAAIVRNPHAYLKK